MKAKLIEMLISALLSMLTPELIRNFLDMVLDFVEDKVIASENTIDDATLLPLCSMIRSTFDIPDNDEVK